MIRQREGGDRLLLAGFALAHVLLLTVVYGTVFSVQYSGVGLFYGFASRLASGLVPYRDFPLEYPPVALVFFTIPRLFASTFAGYAIGFQIEVVVADLASLAAIAAITKRSGGSMWLALVGYTIAVLAIGPIVGRQYDLFPAALTLAALLAFTTRHDDAGWACVALGTLTKLYPLLLAPVWVMILGGRAWRSYALRAVRTFAITCAVALLPLLVVAPLSLRSFFAYHAARGIQLESSYGVLILLLDKLGLTLAGTSLSSGAWNVTGDLAVAFTSLSSILLVASVAMTYAFVARRVMSCALPPAVGDEQRVDVALLASSALLVVLVALVTSKVLSPQYLIWLVPFLPFVARGTRALAWGLFAATGVLTYYIFPMHYTQLIAGEMGAELALLARNLLLVALLVSTVASIRRLTRVDG